MSNIQTISRQPCTVETAKQMREAADLLVGLFYWNSTPDSHKYWSTVVGKLRGYAGEIETAARNASNTESKDDCGDFIKSLSYAQRDKLRKALKL